MNSFYERHKGSAARAGAPQNRSRALPSGSIACCAVDRIVGMRAETEFRRIRLADDDRALWQASAADTGVNAQDTIALPSQRIFFSIFLCLAGPPVDGRFIAGPQLLISVLLGRRRSGESLPIGTCR